MIISDGRFDGCCGEFVEAVCSFRTAGEAFLHYMLSGERVLLWRGIPRCTACSEGETSLSAMMMGTGLFVGV